MAKLINADAVYKILESCEIRKGTIGNPLSDWEYGYTCGIERAESEIECAPTIEVVPVVRCKDCRFYDEKYGWCDCYFLMHFETGENDYCSKAERKEE